MGYYNTPPMEALPYRNSKFGLIENTRSREYKVGEKEIDSRLDILGVKTLIKYLVRRSSMFHTHIYYTRQAPLFFNGLYLMKCVQQP